MATVPGARIVRGDVRKPATAGSAPRRVLSLAPRPLPLRLISPLDHLPGEPRIASDGTLLAIPGIGVHVLVCPLVTAGLVAATVLQLLLS